MKLYSITMGMTVFILFTGYMESLDKIHDERVTYCSKTSDSLTKQLAIQAIRLKLPGYPNEGICVGIQLEE